MVDWKKFGQCGGEGIDEGGELSETEEQTNLEFETVLKMTKEERATWLNEALSISGEEFQRREKVVIRAMTGRSEGKCFIGR